MPKGELTILSRVKVLTVDQAGKQLAAACDQALAGEVVRVQTAHGELIELVPVPKTPATLFGDALRESYGDSDWAAFERNCGSASD